MRRPHRASLARLTLTVNLVVVQCVAGAACISTPRPAPGPPVQPAELAGPFAPSTLPAAIPGAPDPGSARARSPRFVLPPHAGYVDTRVAGRLSVLGSSGLLPPPAGAERYVLDQLTSAVVDAHLDQSGGDRLNDALDDARADGRPVDTYGTGVLSITDLLGDDIHAGLCEPPLAITTVTHEGESWELTLGLAEIENFIGGFSFAMGELPQDCVDDLLLAGGEVAAAAECSTIDEAMFFPEGSDCRACLEAQAGNVVACQDEARCQAEAPVLESEGGEYWNRIEGTLLSCAPDWTVPAYVLMHPTEEGGLPDPFDYQSWGYVCAPFWDESRQAPAHICQGGSDTMRVGAAGLVHGMRRGGDETPWYRHRGFYTPRIVLEDGTELRYAWEAYSSLGVLSYPVNPDDSNGDGVVDAGDDYFGYQYGSWGLNPMRLRPDGTDPDALDDTFARDWFGAMAAKTATVHDGVGILMANHTRCGDWDDLDGDGVYRCTRTEDPVAGWLGDLAHFRWDPDAGYSYPMPVITLGASGLPDPSIPGGIVGWLASSPTLGDPEWDGCTWNNTFTPDAATLPDTPLDYTTPGAVAADTWRFGGHPEADIRLVLYTNVVRDFCPDGGVP